MATREQIERWSALTDRAQGVVDPNPGAAAADWLEMFVSSGVAGMGELIGISPSAEVERWRTGNPTSAFISDLAGVSIPYAGYFKGARMVSRFDHVLDLIGDAEKAPFLTGVAREAARWSPFEAARIGTAAAVGDMPLGETIASSLTDLALAGGIGGIAGSIAAASGRRVPIVDLVPGADLNAPIVLQMRQLREAIDQGVIPAEKIDLATRRLSQFSEASRLEEMKGAYIGDLEVNGTAADGRRLNRLFRLPEPHGNQQFLRRSFTQSGRGFGSKQEWQREAAAAGLPKDFEMLGQFFRHLSFTSAKAARQADQAIIQNMNTVGNGWYWTKEANEGLYVMARKFQGQPTRAAADDKWVVFKTDRPSAFVPTQARWASEQVRRNALWHSDPLPEAPIGAEVFDQGVGLARNMTLSNWLSLAGPGGNAAKMAQRLTKATGLDKLAEKGQGTARAFQEFITEYFTPTAYQTTKSPRGTWVLGIGRAVRDLAETKARQALYGTIAPGQGVLRKILSSPKTTGTGLEAFFKTTDEKDLFQIFKALSGVWDEGAIQAAWAKGEITDNTRDLLKWMLDNESSMFTETINIQQATSRRMTAPGMDEIKLAHSWGGNFRAQVLNEGGETVYIASGRSGSAAEKLAKALVEEAKKAGKNWRFAPAKPTTRESELLAGPSNMTKQVRYKSPDYLFANEARLRLAGEKAPWTKEEFFKMLREHTLSQHRYMADLTTEFITKKDMLKLVDEDPATARIVSARLNDLSYKPGPFARMTNQIADKVLAPMLGKNSASKIAHATNTGLYHLNLASFNIGFPLQNALGFLQTAVPGAVFLMTAPPARLAPHFSYFTVAGRNGLPAATMGALSPIKFAWQALTQLGRPSAALAKAMDDDMARGVLDPRFVEEMVGQNATRLKEWRSFFDGPEGMARYIGALSSYLPTVSEKFTRTLSYSMGWTIGKKFFNMADEQAQQLARDFTHYTMFGYGTEDRARIFTTPGGSMLGLFKNWMMHYMGMMLDYTGLGLREGNWKPLIWQTASTVGTGGVAGTALYGMIDPLAQWMGADPIMKTVYDLMGHGPEDNGIANGVFLGLPAMMGVSLASSLQQPFANPARDASQLFSFVLADRMLALGQAIQGGVEHFVASGQNPILDPNTRDQVVRALAPKVLYRVMANTEDKVLRSMQTGYPQFTDMTAVEQYMYMAGLTPTRIELGYRVNDQLWRDTNAMRNKVKEFGEAYAAAQSAADGRTMWEIQRRVAEAGIDMERVLQSAQARLSRGQESMIESQFSPEQLLSYRAVLNR